VDPGSVVPLNSMVRLSTVTSLLGQVIAMIGGVVSEGGRFADRIACGVVSEVVADAVVALVASSVVSSISSWSLFSAAASPRVSSEVMAMVGGSEIRAAATTTPRTLPLAIDGTSFWVLLGPDSDSVVAVGVAPVLFSVEMEKAANPTIATSAINNRAADASEARVLTLGTPPSFVRFWKFPEPRYRALVAKGY